MPKYYFFYYFSFGRVACAKVEEEEEDIPIGGVTQPIEGCKFEITQDEFENKNLLNLKGKYPYPY